MFTLGKLFIFYFFSVTYFINYDANTCAVVVHLIPNTFYKARDLCLCFNIAAGNICCANSLTWKLL